MNRYTRLALALIVLGAAVASPAFMSSPRASHAAGSGMYVALGDSIAAGVGSSLPRERSYPSLVNDWLSASTGSTVLLENLAVPGETAASFINNGQLQRFQDTVARAHSAGVPVLAVTISLGGNEMLDLQSLGSSDRQAGLDAFRQNFATAMDAVRREVGPDVPVVVTTYYDLTEGDPTLAETDAWWIERFNSVIHDTAGQYQAVVADIMPVFTGRTDKLTHAPYDVHPSNEGHASVARSVWAALAADRSAPVVEVLSPIDAARSTPTLRFRVIDDVGVASVNVSDEWVIAGPFSMSDDEYAVLLDIGDADGDEVRVEIVVTDVAGQVTRRDVAIRKAYAIGDER